VLTDG
jgi:hypothetical protein